MKSNEINELAAALSRAQQTIKSAMKESTNPFFKSKYADLHSIWLACQTPLNVNGLSVVQTIAYQGDAKEYVLATTLIHTSGQWMRGFCPLINVKGDMQGLGSAISYARRYSIAAICGVVTEDDDANTADLKSPGDVISPAKIPRGNSFLEHTDSDNLKGKTNPSEYIIPLKKFLGKKLWELKDFEIINYMDWIKKEGITKPDYVNFLQKAETYLKKRDPSEPPPIESMDIPWPEIQR